ncbi:hypothetical protein G4B88_006108 [Cannabis sativa]|uniref:BAG domain-containing protein n=1 Tax=Cannabis sativa TaxID=3483 RepID=A0A7J6IAU9_CANSA|nr:hypothetical protein G4B88_006108 [Cannabis sativa]
MESPFFRGHWSNFKPRPRYSPSAREISASAKPSPKVVSIPVHFVGSEKKRSDSALKVQKVFRGFLVRKSLKRIAAIRAEVDEIEKRMSQKETMVLIRKDGKERLRMNETLMSLLFRLDSVKGVDSGVRDCRKTVIRKAIRLQERLDAIVTGGDELFLEDKETPAECESLGDDDKAVDHTPDLERESAEVDPSQESSADNTNSSEAAKVKTEENKESNDTMSESGSSIDEKSPIEEEEDTGNKKEENENKEKKNKSSKELLEKMMEENEKMMGLMADLYERNEVQTRLLSSLSHRVEQLERAYICDKLRKKKMKRATAAQCNR